MMQGRVPLFAVLTFVAALNATGAESVKIVYTIPPVGQVATRTSKAEMTMKLTIKGEGIPPQTHDNSSTESLKATRTVLEMKNDIITKAKVTYHSVESSTKGPQGVKEGPRPTSGKTYILEAKARNVIVKTEAGADAPPAEAALAKQEEEREIGRTPAFVGFFHGKTFALGQPVKPDNEAVQMLFGEGFEVESAAVTLKELRNGANGKEAVFTMAVTMVQDQGYMKLTVPMKGEVAMVVETGWPSSMDLSGPIQFTAGQGEPGEPKLTFEGGGTMRIVVGFTYGK